MKFTNSRSYAVRVGADIVAPGASLGDDPVAASPDDDPVVETKPSRRKASKSEEDMK